MKRHWRGRDDGLNERLDALDEERKAAVKFGGRRRGFLAPAFLALLMAALVVGVGFLVSGGEGRSQPAKITVQEGESLSSVAGRMEEAGIIGNAGLFQLRARLQGKATGIKPGTYSFGPEEGAGRILSKLSEGKPVPTFEITVPEGLTIDQTAAIVAKNANVSQEEFKRAAGSTDYDYPFLQKDGVESTEGFLFPKTYEFEEGVNARRIVRRMLEQYYDETGGVGIKEAKQRLSLTEEEIVTAASLIEREAAGDREKPLIASVIYNRIREDMPLQIDAAIQYALGNPGTRLSAGNLEMDSPYNTYENSGLPPTPIASPGLDSIKAAVNPSDTDHLYFVLKKDGERHKFSETYEQHQKAVRKAGR